MRCPTKHIVRTIVKRAGEAGHLILLRLIYRSKSADPDRQGVEDYQAQPSPAAHNATAQIAFSPDNLAPFSPVRDNLILVKSLTNEPGRSKENRRGASAGCICVREFGQGGAVHIIANPCAPFFSLARFCLQGCATSGYIQNLARTRRSRHGIQMQREMIDVLFWAEQIESSNACDDSLVFTCRPIGAWTLGPFSVLGRMYAASRTPSTVQTCLLNMEELAQS